MISQQEHEAWDVLLACQGQLRLAPSGYVVGFDLDVALRSGSTDTITSADMSLRKDGVNA